MATIQINETSVSRTGPGVSLLPEKTECTLTITLRYQSDGRWDVDDFLDKLSSGVRREMGVDVDFRFLVRLGGRIMDQIKQSIIEQNIQAVSDVLAEFELNQASLRNPPIDISPLFIKLPLLFKHTGFKCWLEYMLDRDDKPDEINILPGLERCFRAIYHLNPGMKVFSDAQRHPSRRSGLASSH